MVKEIHITLTYRFVERAIFILIILFLLILLITKFAADTKCDCNEIGGLDVDSSVASPNSDKNSSPETTVKENDVPVQPNPEPDPKPEPEPVVPKSSGEVEITVGKIDWDIQSDGRAKINNIKITVENGLEDDIILFATIDLEESGNNDIKNVNPFWDEVKLPLVKAGKTEVVNVDPSKSWPPGVEDGDTVLISGNFKDFQGAIDLDSSTTQKI